MLVPGKLLILLSSTCRLFVQYANKAFSEAGCPVGYLQFVTLKAIFEAEAESGPSFSVKQIADSVGIERSTLSHNSDALEKHGYIIKKSRKPGQPITALSLTDLGKDIVTRWMGTYEQITQAATNGVSEKLGEELERIGSNLL